MRSPKKTGIARALKLLLIIYIIGGVILYLIQDLLLFHPTPLTRDHKFSFNQPFEEVNISIGKNNLSIVKFKPNPPRKGLVLFFHGNMHNVERYKKYPSLFTGNGYEIWMLDYPGFGKSTGKRTEQFMYEQATIMYDLARKEINSDSIIIYGKSIGTGVASYLASIESSDKLILETPYYSAVALAKYYFPIYPVSAMIRYSFPIHDYLKKIKFPVTIFHGTDDEVVPYKQGKQLAEENQNIKLVTIEKGKHNNLFDFELFQQQMNTLLKR